MHINKRQRLTITGMLLMSGWLSLAPAAAAAAAAAAKPAPAVNPNVGQALEIAPPVVYLTVNPGQTIKTQILLRDISSGDLIVSGTANDFVASGEDGTPKILIDNNDNNNPYSLRTWINPPVSLNLVPKEIKSMEITINVPANASPGGHYGVIRFTATPPSLKASGVSLATSLGALMLVTVNGNIKENLSVQEFSVNHGGSGGSIFQSGPLNFVERIKNNGNVHEQPTGQVAITDMFGKKLASLNVNVPPRNVLPASIRKFSEPLDKSVIGSKKLFGHYTAKLNLSYGRQKHVVAASLGFWVIPYTLIIVVIVVLIAAFFLLRFAIKRYNQRIITRARGGGSGTPPSSPSSPQPPAAPSAPSSEESAPKDQEPPQNRVQ